jgi:endoglucanase
VIAAAALAGCGGDAPSTPRAAATPAATPATTPSPTPTPTPEPTAVADAAPGRFFVDPRNHAVVQERQWRAEGRTADADRVHRIARQPTATWFSGEEEGLASTDPAAEAAGLRAVTLKARTLTQRATAAGRTAIIVAFNVPHRDCGSHSAGGARDAAAYARWIRALGQGIGPRKALVILEPDAVAAVADVGARCLPQPQVAERVGLLRAAVRELGRQHGVQVYLDGGNPGWVRPHGMADLMRRAGVAEADGFSVNVSNFKTTKDSVAYGDELGGLLGGSHYVVDTGRNGNGPYGGRSGPEWCNPPGRALGRAPTTHTGAERADAFLWIKQPGDSDGSCRDGEPPAGQWWPDYALELVRNAR